MEKNQGVLSIIRSVVYEPMWYMNQCRQYFRMIIFHFHFYFHVRVLYKNRNKDFETNSCAHYIGKDIIVKNHEKEASDCGMKGRHIGIACDILNPIIRDEISGIFPDFFCTNVSI